MVAVVADVAVGAVAVTVVVADVATVVCLLMFVCLLHCKPVVY